MRWRCLSCGGEYDDTQPDGSAYYHACPDIKNPAWLDPNEAGITNSEANRRAAVREFVSRPDGRDENVDPKSKDNKKKREGKGRVQI